MSRPLCTYAKPADLQRTLDYLRSEGFEISTYELTGDQYTIYYYRGI